MTTSPSSYSMWNPRVVFFDLGQTLVTGPHRSARVSLAERLGLSEKEAGRVGKTIMVHDAIHSLHVAGAVSRVLPARDPALIEMHVEALWHEQETSVKEMPGAAALVRSLKSMGIRLGIISNTWHPFYSGFLRSCPELSVHFDHRILSYREGCKKPSTVLFRRALQEAGESPHSCWMIGDSYELDIEPAMKIGMRTIWLLHHPEKEIPLLAKVLRGEKRSPDQVFEDLEQIRTYFSHNIQQGGAHV